MTKRLQIFRLDSDAVKILPSGSIRIEYARFARTGIQTYVYPGGEEINELRRPEQVFSQQSIDSWKASTVTMRHPRDFVSPNNWKDVSVGSIADNVRQDGDFLVSSIIIHEKSAIKKVLDREAVELSGGYDTDVISSSGEWNGQRFDAEQTNIVGNHVALLALGEARGGRDVRLHLDSGQIAYKLDEKRNIWFPDWEPKNKKEPKVMAKKINLDGVPYEYEADDSFDVALKKSLDRIDSVTSESNGLKEEIKLLKKENDELKGKLEKSDSVETINQKVAERLELVQGAEKLGIKSEDTKDKTDREIMVMAIGESIRIQDDATEDFVRGAFLARIATIETQEPSDPKSGKTDHLDDFTKNIQSDPKKEEDAFSRLDSLEAKSKLSYLERNREAAN